MSIVDAQNMTDQIAQNFHYKSELNHILSDFCK